MDTGRPDYYYSIEYSDPDTGSFIVDSERYVSTFYTISDLRPNTPYTVVVTSHNGVSDQDSDNEALRRVSIQTRTSEGGESVS